MIKPFEKIKAISKEEYLLDPSFFDSVFQRHWYSSKWWKNFNEFRKSI